MLYVDFHILLLCGCRLDTDIYIRLLMNYDNNATDKVFLSFPLSANDAGVLSIYMTKSDTHTPL